MQRDCHDSAESFPASRKGAFGSVKPQFVTNQLSAADVACSGLGRCHIVNARIGLTRLALSGSHEPLTEQVPNARVVAAAHRDLLAVHEKNNKVALRVRADLLDVLKIHYR